MQHGKGWAVWSICCSVLSILPFSIALLIVKTPWPNEQLLGRIALLVISLVLAICAFAFGLFALLGRKWRIKGGLRIAIMMNVIAIAPALLLLVIVPNLPKSKILGTGPPAIPTLRLLSSVQEQYVTRFGAYATLEQLCDAGYIDYELSESTTPRTTKSGYYYIMKVDGNRAWCCVARPIVWDEDGEWNFMTATDGIIYYNKTKNSSAFVKKIRD